MHWWLFWLPSSACIWAKKTQSMDGSVAFTCNDWVAWRIGASWQRVQKECHQWVWSNATTNRLKRATTLVQKSCWCSSYSTHYCQCQQHKVSQVNISYACWASRGHVEEHSKSFPQSQPLIPAGVFGPTSFHLPLPVEFVLISAFFLPSHGCMRPFSTVRGVWI